MMTDTNNEYTLENLPTTITKDQFYCYGIKTGKITLGELIGVSAITKLTHYKIFGCTYKTHMWLSDEVSELTENNFKCFSSYQDFIKSYNEYLSKKVKKNKTNKTRYIVNKSIFSCKETKASSVPYNTKEFDNKQDAIDYANKGLEKLKKEINKTYATLNELLKELKLIRTKVLKIDYGSTGVIYSEITPASPHNLKENDILTKIEIRKFKILSYLDVNDNYLVSVKYFISPGIAKLSDNTVFFNSESNLSYSKLIYYAQAKEAKKICKEKAINRIIEVVEYEIKSIATKLVPYLKEYEPLKKWSKQVPWYNKKYTKDLIDDLKEIITLFNEVDYE